MLRIICIHMFFSMYIGMYGRVLAYNITYIYSMKTLVLVYYAIVGCILTHESSTRQGKARETTTNVMMDETIHRNSSLGRRHDSGAVVVVVMAGRLRRRHRCCRRYVPPPHLLTTILLLTLLFVVDPLSMTVKVHALSSSSSSTPPGKISTTTTPTTTTNPNPITNDHPRRHDKKKLVIVGLGRVGLECGVLATPWFHEVVGTVRQLDDDNDNNMDGIQRIPLDRRDLIQSHLSTATHILWTIPLSSTSSSSPSNHPQDSTTTREKEAHPPQPHHQPHFSDSNLEFLWNEVSQLQQQQPTTTTNDNADDNDIHNPPPCVCEWMGFVSTTGVYGNHDGAIVTEESSLHCPPFSNADLYRVFEERWLSLQSSSLLSSSHCRSVVFRCAGIYDSNRSALHTVYNRQLQPPPPQQPQPQQGIVPSLPLTTTVDAAAATTTTTAAATNRIHSYDIARAIVASMTTRDVVDDDNNDDEEEASVLDANDHDTMSLPNTTLGRRRTHGGRGIYNLADDDPAPRSIVLNYAAELLESIGALPAPQPAVPTEPTNPTTTTTTTTATTTVSTRERRRLTDRKWVSNQKMKDELVPQLTYPTYREGLKAILMDPNTPWQKQQQQQQQQPVETTTTATRATSDGE